MQVEAELRAVSEGAWLRPMPELAALGVTGADRQRWLAGMVTGDLKSLAPGAGLRSLVVDKTGRIVAEVWLVVEAERVVVGVRRELAGGLRAHLDAYLVMEDAELEVVEGLAFWLALGPRAEHVASEASRLGGSTGTGALGDLPFGVLAIPHEASPNLAEELTARTGAVLGTPAGWDRLRAERLLPEFGVDFEVGCYPQEARLERFAVSFDKGCYVGQEAVFMLEKRGHPPRRLVRLRLEGGASVEPGADVRAPDGAVTGKVTTVAPDGDDAWALAIVRYKHAAAGTELAVAGRTARVSDP